MPSPILRPATREDIESLAQRFGVNPTMRGIVADLDGRVLAIGGVFRHQGRWYAFCDLSDEMRSHKMTLMRAGKKLVAMLREMGLQTAYAYPDPKEPRSMQWLMSLGFAPCGRADLYRWTP